MLESKGARAVARGVVRRQALQNGTFATVRPQRNVPGTYKIGVWSGRRVRVGARAGGWCAR